MNVGSSTHDILVPSGGYSASCFESYLQAGNTYAITMHLSAEVDTNANNQSFGYWMDIDNPHGSNWYAEAIPGSNILEAFVSPSTSGYYEISTGMYGYLNPYLADGSYELQVWQLPSSHPSDDTNWTATALDEGLERIDIVFGWYASCAKYIVG